MTGYERIFIEHQVRELPRVHKILQSLDLPAKGITYIEKLEDVFGRVDKPYLQKRSNLNLFIGRKEGALVKEAPEAYGTVGSPHYYYIHQYNCTFECEYCYLQGYFHSPDIVLFVNHEEICAEIESICEIKHANEAEVWFHGGEFSDSLNLAHITNELSLYWELMKKLPRARLELRTKSINLLGLRNLAPLDNVFLSFSLSASTQAAQFDRGVPSIAKRLRAMSALEKRGFRLGVHLDPIVYCEDYKDQYEQLAKELLSAVREETIAYVSLGVVRFSKMVHKALQRHYPKSQLLATEMVTATDGKVRYSRPLRLEVLKNVRAVLERTGISKEKIYFCME